MVVRCSAYGCKEKFIKGGPFTFHKFPRDEQRRKLWESNIHRKDFSASKYSLICSKHFTADCFERQKFGGTWLKKDAVPTIFLFPPHFEKKKQFTFKLRKLEDDLQSTPETAGSSERKTYLGDFTEKDMNSPILANKALKIAKRVINHKNRTIKDLNRRNRILKRKIASLSEILGSVRNGAQITDSAEQVLQGASKDSNPSVSTVTKPVTDRSSTSSKSSSKHANQDSIEDSVGTPSILKKPSGPVCDESIDTSPSSSEDPNSFMTEESIKCIPIQNDHMADKSYISVQETISREGCSLPTEPSTKQDLNSPQELLTKQIYGLPQGNVGSLFQPPVLIKEEIVISDDENAEENTNSLPTEPPTKLNYSSSQETSKTENYYSVQDTSAKQNYSLSQEPPKTQSYSSVQGTSAKQNSSLSQEPPTKKICIKPPDHAESMLQPPVLIKMEFDSSVSENAENQQLVEGTFTKQNYSLSKEPSTIKIHNIPQVNLKSLLPPLLIKQEIVISKDENF